MSENWTQSEICIVINDKSQDRPSTAKHLSGDGLLHYKFIIQFAGETVFLIGEHLPKLQAKSLVMSYAKFGLDFCPQRCRTRWISKMTCVLRTETVTDCCYVNRQINVSLLTVIWYSITHSLFLSRLKTFILYKSFPL